MTSLRHLVLAFALMPLAAVDYLSTGDALALAFPASGKVERYVPAPTIDQMRLVVERARSTARGTLGEIWAGHTGGTLDGVAIIDHVIGRTEFITYLCVIGAGGTVRRLEIMAYREAYGGEIRDGRFLAQFVGIGPDDPLRRDRPVTNIAGATMSVDALCERVRFLLDFHAVVLQPGITTWIASRPPTPAPAGPALPCERSAAVGNAPLSISISGGGDGAATAADAAIAEAQRLDAVLNRWRPDSELARLNSAGGGPVSADLLSAVLQARGIWESSGKRFDPTVSPVIVLWNTAAEQNTAPEPTALAAATALVGFGLVQIDGTTNTIRLPTGGSLDLGGIAKGRIIDLAGAVLSARLPPAAQAYLRHGESSHLVLGGTEPVIITLRHPADPSQQLQRIALKPGNGLGCASAAGRVFTIQGRAYSHLIDPLTGKPAPMERAAWVIAPSAALADGLDTALCLVDAEDALRLAAAHGVIAQVWDGMRLHHSPGWPMVSEP